MAGSFTLASSGRVRYATGSIMYFAQGIPQGLLAISIPVWLASQGVTKGIYTRSRSVRADARVGSIRTTIEGVFGLPEGSVKLCDPEGNSLRADAKISTLRRRWDE